MSDTSKTAKIIKGDIISLTITSSNCQCAVEYVCKLIFCTFIFAAWKILVSETVKLFHKFERYHLEQGR